MTSPLIARGVQDRAAVVATEIATNVRSAVNALIVELE
jgi:hypothetical protein